MAHDMCAVEKCEFFGGQHYLVVEKITFKMPVITCSVVNITFVVTEIIFSVGDISVLVDKISLVVVKIIFKEHVITSSVAKVLHSG